MPVERAPGLPSRRRRPRPGPSAWTAPGRFPRPRGTGARTTGPPRRAAGTRPGRRRRRGGPPRPFPSPATATAAPLVDLVREVPGAPQLDEPALLQAAPEGQERGVEVEARRAASGEEQGDPAPGLRRVDEPRRVGGPALPPAARPALAQHLHLPAGSGDLGERADGVGGVQEGRLPAGQLRRQAQLDLEAVAQAGRDQDALGQQPRRAVEDGGRAAGARRRIRSRRSPAPKARGRAGTGARRGGPARPRRRIRRGPTAAGVAAAGGASGTGPGRGRAARLRGSAPAARRPRGRRPPRRATPAAFGVRSWLLPYAPSSGSARISRA